jgi:hypothetical protein
LANREDSYLLPFTINDRTDATTNEQNPNRKIDLSGTAQASLMLDMPILRESKGVHYESVDASIYISYANIS